MADEDAEFVRIVEQYRRELQLHCYRMLGSYVDAEDHVQETMLRAWRKRESFEGRSTFRTWLYRIATNACLDTLRGNPERVVATDNPAEIEWLQPYPDELLPDSMVVAKETIELAYLVAIQFLPPNQRAVLILRDVLGWSAKETADLLETSVASANSALQRARATIADQQVSRDGNRTAEPTDDERALLDRYVDAHRRADVGAVAALLKADVRFTMPPQPLCFLGADDVTRFFAEEAFARRDFLLVPTRANGQLAAANYTREDGDTEFRAMSLDVLRIVDGRIAEITTFEPHLFPAFGLPGVWVSDR